VTHLLLAVVVGFAVTQVAIAATTVYLHRCLAHRAVALKGPVPFAFRLVLWLSTGIKPRAWAAVHRKHHAFTDTDQDPHSPAIMGWVRVQLTNPALYRRSATDPATLDRFGKDLPADAWDRVLFDRSGLGLGIGITLLIVLLGPIWGVVAAAFHMAAYLELSGAVNAVGHRFGRRPFENSATILQSLALVTGGEGLHNNHHAAPTSATFALQRGQVDLGFWLIRALSAVKLATVRLERPAFTRPKAPRSPQPVG
jgi:stearoyl-CoA desaturase (delta-9 desaturase)